MKFKSELAQKAYEEILESGEQLITFMHPEHREHEQIRPASWETTARAIEVAAKIELEEMRLEQEKMKGWIPQDVGRPDRETPTNPHILVYKTGGEHTRGPYWLCEKCKSSWDGGFKPIGECSVTE